MGSAEMLLVGLIWVVNAVCITLVIKMYIASKHAEKQADLEITDYVYSDGKWVRL